MALVEPTRTPDPSSNFYFHCARKTGLKTLDKSHLASVQIASRIYRQKIDYFIMLDEDILKHKEEIKNLIEVKITAPIRNIRDDLLTIQAPTADQSLLTDQHAQPSM
jgi:endonuclease III-like uncharacterized protein